MQLKRAVRDLVVQVGCFKCRDFKVRQGSPFTWFFRTEDLISIFKCSVKSISLTSVLPSTLNADSTAPPGNRPCRSCVDAFVHCDPLRKNTGSCFRRVMLCLLKAMMPVHKSVYMSGTKCQTLQNVLEDNAQHLWAIPTEKQAKHLVWIFLLETCSC